MGHVEIVASGSVGLNRKVSVGIDGGCYATFTSDLADEHARVFADYLRSLNPEPKLRRVVATFCELCLEGAGTTCNVPGCALFRSVAPDIDWSGLVEDVDGRAWLIERDGPLFWSGRQGCGEWTTHVDALRFSRWKDADRMRISMGFENARVSEHIWTDAGLRASRESGKGGSEEKGETE